MMQSAEPPFRAGPGREPAARAGGCARLTRKALQGQLGAAALHELQDRCIRDVIRFQESVGLHAITDGEYRRSSFHADFIEKLAGARAAGALDVKDAESGLDEKRTVIGKRFAPRAFTIVGKLRHAQPIEVENFRFVKANTTRTANRRCRRPPCCCAAAARQ